MPKKRSRNNIVLAKTSSTWRQMIFICLGIFALSMSTGIAEAQNEEAKGKRLSQSELLEMSKPGPNHRQLAALSGDWNCDVNMGSDAKYQGVANCRMVAGNRFLSVEYSSKGKNDVLEGVFHIGFDRRHGHYTLVSMDSFGTYFVTSKGKPDEETGKIKMYGTDDDPNMKAMGYKKEFVHVLDIRGENEFSVEVWFVDTRTEKRRETKFMEHNFKRSK